MEQQKCPAVNPEMLQNKQKNNQPNKAPLNKQKETHKQNTKPLYCNKWQQQQKLLRI